jgi:nucleoside-diphosphate-sugar epimerase
MQNYSQTVLEDLQSLISDAAIPWEKLRGCTVLITGATGMIGRACARVLSLLGGIQILALGRNEAKGAELEQLPNVRFIKHDITEPLNIEETIDYIIHCAAVTKSTEMVANPVGVIDTELLGAKNMLELALQKGVKGFLYSSSMESYGILDLPTVKETDQGYIDLTNPRSSYPMSKRMVELLCNCYHSQYGLNTDIVRLGMTFGAGEDFQHDNRVWAQFARRAAANMPIILHTEGTSVRAFNYLSDALRGMFLVLLTAPKGEIYNIAAIFCCIREFAESVAEEFGLEVKIEPPPDVGKLGYISEYKLPLDSGKVQGLGWCPINTSIVQIFNRLIRKET